MEDYQAISQFFSNIHRIYQQKELSRCIIHMRRSGEMEIEHSGKKENMWLSIQYSTIEEFFPSDMISHAKDIAHILGSYEERSFTIYPRQTFDKFIRQYFYATPIEESHKKEKIRSFHDSLEYALPLTNIKIAQKKI